MENVNKKITSFLDLLVWQESHKLAIMIYNATKKFPKEELFGLVSQMRRCSISITSNIAEGFSRESYKEKVQFYAISRGSLTELQSQLLISRDIKILPEKVFVDIMQQFNLCHKLLNAFIKKTKEISRSKKS